MDTEYISLADAQYQTGISKDYFRICIQKGYLKGVKIGRNWVTRKEWVNEYLVKYRAGEVSLPEEVRPLSSEVGLPSPQLIAELKRELFREFKAKATGTVGAFATITIFFGIGVLAFTAPPFINSERIAITKSVQPSITELNSESRKNFIRIRNAFTSTRSQIAISQNTSSPPFEKGRLGATPPFDKGRLGGIFAFTLPSLHLPKFSLPSLSFSLAPLRSFFTPLEIGRLKTTVKSLMGFSELFKSSPPPPSEIAISQNPSSPPFENLSSTAIEEGRLGASPPFEKGRLGGISLPKEVRPLASEVRLPEEVGLQRVNEITRIVERRQTLIPVDLAAVKSSLLSDLQSLNQSLKNEITQDLSSLRSLYSRLSSENQSQTRVITLTQKIDTLGSATLSNITFSGTGNQFNLKDADIPDDITLTGSLNPSSLTAQTLSVSGTGTSTYSGGIKATSLDITSTTATSTFANGLQLSSGCFRLPDGTCAGSGGGTINTGTANRLAYYSAATTLDSVSFLSADTSNSRLGIGTTSPGTALSVMGTTTLSGGLTVYATTSLLSLTATSTATSTFTGGLSAGGLSSSQGFTLTGGSLIYPSANFILTSSGLLGAGTTTPGSLLSIHGGNLQVTGTSTTNALIATSTLFVGSTGQLFNVLQNGLVGIGTTSPGSLLSVHGGNAQITGTTTASGLVATSTLFVGATGNLFNVLSNGLVGIGTTSPGSLLSIHGGNLQITGTSTVHALIATSTLFVGTNGNLFNVLQNGLVGIGTTSPGSLLSIHGGNVQITGTTTASALVATSTLFVGSTGQLFNVLQNGFVGIGTTSPSSLLSIQGISNFVQAATSTLYTTLSLPNLYSTSTIATSSIAGSLYVASSTPTQNALFAVGTSSPSLWIDRNSGNLGIGTSSPASTLSLSSATQNPGLLLTYTGTGNTLYIEDAANDTTPFVIDASGNVGIGTTSPATKLAVGNTGNNAVFYIDSATENPFVKIKTPNTDAVKDFQIVNGNNNTTFLTQANGNVSIGTSSPSGGEGGEVNLFSVGSVLNGNAPTSAYFAGHVGIGYSRGDSGMLHVQNPETGGNYDGIRIHNTEATANVYAMRITGTSAYGIYLDTNPDDNCFDNGAAALCSINDYAEMMEFSEMPTDGDIITVDTDNPGLLKIADKANDSLIVGVASENPAMVIGSYGISIKGWAATTTKDGYPVYPLALIGRKYIKVTNENGDIKSGDRITSSSLKGYGTRATQTGSTVGTALTEFNGSQATTTVFLEDGKEIKVGKILVFVNLGYSKLDSELSEVGLLAGSPTSNATNGWTIDQQTGRVTAAFTGGLNLQGNSLENVSKILSANGGWSIDENGKLIVQDLEVKGKAKFGTPENPQGITVYDKATRLPKCVSVENDVVKIEQGGCE